MTHVAQNPTDWKHVQFGLAKPGSVVGCDFSGEVVEVGQNATGTSRTEPPNLLDGTPSFRELLEE